MKNTSPPPDQDGRQVRDACMAALPEFRAFLSALNRDFGPIPWRAVTLRKLTPAERSRIHAPGEQLARDRARIAANQALTPQPERAAP